MFLYYAMFVVICALKLIESHALYALCILNWQNLFAGPQPWFKVYWYCTSYKQLATMEFEVYNLIHSNLKFYVRKQFWILREFIWYVMLLSFAKTCIGIATMMIILG